MELTITTPAKANTILKKASVPDEEVIAHVLTRSVGTGGGYKGARHSQDTVALLKEALETSKVNIDTPEAYALSMSVTAAFGNLRWHMRPADDGTWTQGPHPFAPLNHTTFPNGAAIAKLPPCGSFAGGYEVVARGIRHASGKAKEKRGIFVYRMSKGTLEVTPALLLEEGTSAWAKMEEVANAAQQPLEMVVLLNHMASDNQGGKAIAALRPKPEKVEKPKAEKKPKAKAKSKTQEKAEAEVTKPKAKVKAPPRKRTKAPK